ncbi:MAG: PAS domain S-box protein [Gammaproteobacteria bacterium]|nr:PAS domain S-box protein [Gammaproteobacteria bacterium]MCP5136756.1 PAS domain S-box protein [Gammaproteobacteria bacterium]
MSPIDSLKLTDIPFAPAVTATTSTSLRTLLNSLRDADTRAAVIYTDGHEGDKPVALLTAHELLTALNEPEANLDRTVGEIHTSTPLRLKLNISLHAACAFMAEQQVRHAIVVDESGNLRGVVAEQDILAGLSDHLLPRETEHQSHDERSSAVAEATAPPRAAPFSEAGGIQPNNGQTQYAQRLQDLINNMEDWVWEVDDEGRFTFVSRRIQDVLGYDPDWVLGITPADLMSKEESDRWMRDFRETGPSTATFCNREYRHRHRDGHERMFSISGSPILDADGSLRGYRGISRDITDAYQANQSLQHREAELRAIFDNASVGIMFLTGYRIFARGNQRLADILGYASPEEMIGISMQKLHLSPERFVEFGRTHYEPLRQQVQMHVEYELRRKDGSAVWCMLSGKAIDPTTPADLSLGVIWVIDDISARKADAIRLSDTLGQLAEERDLFTAGPVMVFRWLPEEHWPVSYCSPNVERILGVSPSEFIDGKRGFAEFVHPRDIGRLQDEVRHHTEARHEVFEHEYRLRSADGKWRTVSDFTRVLRDANDRVTSRLGYLVDISERSIRQAELRTLLDAIPDLIFFKDEHGQYLECNDAFTRFVGRPRSQIIDHSDAEFFAPEIAAFFRDMDRKMLTSGQPRRNEEWVDYPDGSRYLLDTLKMPFARNEKDPLGVLGISRDITVQHRLAQDLQRAQELADIGSSYENIRTGEGHWSATFYRIFDLDPDRVSPGIPALLSRVEDVDRERVRTALDSIREGQQPSVALEFRIRRQDGRKRHLFTRYERVEDQHGQPVRIDGIVQDITTKTESLRRLTRSEERLREAQELAHMGSWTLDIPKQRLEWSEEIHRIFGTDPAQFQPSLDGFLAAVHPDDRESVSKAFQGALTDHTPYRIIHRLVRPDQSIRYVEERARILYDSQNEPGRAIGTVADITERQLGEIALRESEMRYRSIFESAHQGMLILGEDGTISSANQTACDMLGYPGPDAILSAHPQALSPPRQPDGEDSFSKGSKLIADAFRKGYVRFEWEHLHLDGHLVPIEVTLSHITQNGRRALFTTWFDLSDKRRAEELESRASVVFENTSEGIMVTDAETRILSVNPAFTKITGYSDDEVRGRRPNFLQSSQRDPGFYELMWRQLNESGRWQGEIQNRRKNGETYPEWLSISTLRNENGTVRNYIGVFSDISASRHFEERIEQLSHFDGLTQLPNPVLLRARLAQTLDTAKASNNAVAAILLRVDGFDRMISSLGHDAADRLLANIARRLRSIVPEDATLSRFGADTFALTEQISRAPHADSASRLALDLQNALRKGIDTAEIGRLSIPSNVGIAMYPSDTDEGDILLRFAESALHTARDIGPGALAFYHPAMTEAATRRIQLEQSLRDALANNEFELHFQPRVSLNSGIIVGVEALIRWRQNDGSRVLPSEFMPIIETSDLVLPVGRWVLRTAAQTVRDWQRAGLGNMPVSVNISGAMILNGILPQEISTALEETGLDPALLEIEVLENVLLSDPVLATSQLDQAHRLGVTIALDDFGTGYSSLAYLQKLPFDTIKIDRAFIEDLEHSVASQSVVRATLSMARTMKRKVVAEGVETELQAQQLMRLGCDAIQGYLTGRPMPADQIAQILTDHHEDRLSALIASLTNPKALLVEDDPDQRHLLSSQLEAAHWTVKAVATAEEARSLMSEEPIDLLLVDYGLPGMDGLKLLENCRARHPETVRIMISVSHDPDLIQRAINHGGVFRYLVKPVSDQRLLDTLNDVRGLTQRLWQGGAE